MPAQKMASPRDPGCQAEKDPEGDGILGEHTRRGGIDDGYSSARLVHLLSFLYIVPSSRAFLTDGLSLKPCRPCKTYLLIMNQPALLLEGTVAS